MNHLNLIDQLGALPGVACSNLLGVMVFPVIMSVFALICCVVAWCIIVPMLFEHHVKLNRCNKCKSDRQDKKRPSQSNNLALHIKILSRRLVGLLTQRNKKRGKLLRNLRVYPFFRNNLFIRRLKFFDCFKNLFGCSSFHKRSLTPNDPSSPTAAGKERGS